MTRLLFILFSAVLVVPVLTGDAPIDTNCRDTTFGCCADGATIANDLDKSNCQVAGGGLLGGCDGAQFGCCEDGTYADDVEKSNCQVAGGGLLGGCDGAQFGCCEDGTYADDVEKSNCLENTVNRGFKLIGRNSTNATHINTFAPSQQPLRDNSELILIIIGASTFFSVALSIALLIIAVVVIISYRSFQRRRIRKFRLSLECELEEDMGDPLMVEEFGVSIPTVNT